MAANNGGELQTSQLLVGSVVRAKAGRDSGCYYVIYQIIDKKFVYLIDGRKRSLSNPKRKNYKHLEVIYSIDDELAQVICAGGKAVDALIRARLRRVVPTEHREEGLLNAQGRLD